MGLTLPQVQFLLEPIQPARVKKLKGNSHVEAWDIRRNLIRVFGFGGWDEEIREVVLLHETTGPKLNDDGQPIPGKYQSTVVYRVTMRLTVKDPAGNTVAFYDDAATGDAVNQPQIGDAHDLALKAAVSQALKRCAVNLGDQYGLSLYDDGRVTAVVQKTLVSPPAEEAVS